MRALCFLVSVLCCGNCLNITIPRPSYSEKLMECIIGIVSEYFTELKVITYVGNKVQDEALLQAISTGNIVSVVSKRSSQKLLLPHQAYLISAQNPNNFVDRLKKLIKESSWNPTARFLIIVRQLGNELGIIFDSFLKLHVNNVLVINATDDAHLYTYNPFDNYNCGKRYDTIISYGKCSHSHSITLYPNKLITGLQNCIFNVHIPQEPPYTILSSNDSHETSPLQNGVEPYLLRLIGEMLGFDINVVNNYGVTEEFPTVSTDMEAIGTLKKIQDNEADIVLGGMLLTPSRASAFSYVYGPLVYTDEIRFVVKRAKFKPVWKNVYLEFGTTVWVLLILAVIFYSMIIIILLRTKDKSYVVLILMSNLVLHGRNIQTRWLVKCVLLFWVVFAYLVNTFYQSSLFSLTTNPAKEYQISTEEDIAKYQLKPCLSFIMGKYYQESVQSSAGFDETDGCYGLMESVKTVSKSKDLYSIILYGVYQYEQDIFDEFGEPLVISLPIPYSKVIYAFYMYKGFPLIDNLRHKSLRLRENGLVDKVMRDMIYLNRKKKKFRPHEFVVRFAIPWILYIFGCTVSVIVFVIEIMSKHQ